jgi:hypothetical protein
MMFRTRRSLFASTSFLAPLLFLATAFGGCSSGSDPNLTAAQSGDADLVAAKVGRLVDVYGLRSTALGVDIELFETDVLVGPDIQDERDSGSQKRDSDITFDFFGVNPGNLQPRLLITRQLGSPGFRAAFERLSVRAQLVSVGHFGQDTVSSPFSAVARNAAFMLVFNRDLGLPANFFTERDASGRVIAVRNPEAVQLLEIRGDPGDRTHEGDYRVNPTRVIAKANLLIVDPVLLGGEGQEHGVPNNARGLPESSNSISANLRLALDLTSPLRIPGLRPPANERLIGTNNSAHLSLIRDFRSANRNDSDQHTSRGFARDPINPRIESKIVRSL